MIRASLLLRKGQDTATLKFDYQIDSVLTAGGDVTIEGDGPLAKKLSEEIYAPFPIYTISSAEPSKNWENIVAAARHCSFSMNAAMEVVTPVQYGDLNDGEAEDENLIY